MENCVVENKSGEYYGPNCVPSFQQDSHVGPHLESLRTGLLLEIRHCKDTPIMRKDCVKT